MSHTLETVYYLPLYMLLCICYFVLHYFHEIFLPIHLSQDLILDQAKDLKATKCSSDLLPSHSLSFTLSLPAYFLVFPTSSLKILFTLMMVF
jgi:hypothetical protein